MKKVLIIDDDHFFHQVIKSQLQTHDLECHTCKTLSAAKDWLDNHGKPDIILLDYDLGPGQKSGIDICRQIKADMSLPLIMVSGDDRIQTIVACLDAGADQYILKPYALEELLARMRAAFRLYDRTEEEQGEPLLGEGTISLNTQSGDLIIGDTQVRLTDMEIAVTRLLLRHFGGMTDRDELCQTLYGRDFDPANRSLDVLVGRLRKKIAAISSDYAIKNVRGKGYRLHRSAIRSKNSANGKIASAIRGRVSTVEAGTG